MGERFTFVSYTTELEKKVLSLENDIKNYKERELATAAEGTVYILCLCCVT